MAENERWVCVPVCVSVCGESRTSRYFSRGLSPFKGWSHHERSVPAGRAAADHVDNEAACVGLNHLEHMRRAVAWPPSAINCLVLLDLASMVRRDGLGGGERGRGVDGGRGRWRREQTGEAASWLKLTIVTAKL